MADKRKTNDHIIESQLKTVDTKLQDGVFIFTSPMSVGDFATKIKKPSTAIVAYFFKQGKMFNINHILDEEQIAELCIEFGYDFQKETEVNAQNFMDQVEIKDEAIDLITKPPVITIMGHVDHGKTTLIDKIRNANVAGGEAGGITQHTGAYQVEYQGKKITFLDTPGHEAFSAMRARGAQLTDIVVLVVAGDDGVKPQTKEAVAHAKASKVPIIVFVNKMDKQGVNPEKVISELSALDVVAEEWGGDIQFIYGSGLKGTGIDELFSAINVQAEVLELKANPNRLPIGVVVESRVDKGRGPIATIIVENGTLFSRDFIVAGSQYGRIRTMTDSDMNPIESAAPGTPVVITGLNYSPNAGDKFFGFSDERFAKKLALDKSKMDKAEELKERSLLKVEGDFKVFNVIVKADVQGTTEAVKHALAKLENDEAKVNVIRASVGAITKSDILLAQTAHATLFCFNIRPSAEMKVQAEDAKVEIRTYSIIYKMIEDVEAVLKGMQAPKFEEQITGEALIQKVIFFSKVGNIAGCLMTQGEIFSNSKIRIIRDSVIIHQGTLDSLQRGKDQAKKVENGKDFGCHIRGFDDIREGDIIEAYKMIEVDQ